MQQTPRRALLVAAGTLALAAGLGRGADARPKGRRAAVARVIVFTGWIPIFQAVGDSAMAEVVRALAEQGVAAELHAPPAWPEIAADLSASAARPRPLVVVGYSAGAGAATALATTVGQTGIGIRRMILVEAYDPGPIPANVSMVVHYYATSAARTVTPGPGFTGPISNVDLRERIPGIGDTGHVGMSRTRAVQELIVSDVVAAAR